MILKSAIACAMGDDINQEAPIQQNLPNYKTPPRIRSEKRGMSYELKETQLPEGFKEQLLFNTKFVSVPSGSEGGNIEGGVDDQLIIDQEEYFKLTQFYPDAQVKISRIEKALSFLKHDDSKVYPGYLVLAIKDLYGQSCWDVFMGLKVDWPKISKILINRFDETLRNYYMTDDITWRNYLHYENGVIGGQLMTKVPEPNLTLPMTINVQDHLESLKKLLHLICGIIKTSEISQDIQRSSELFFKIIENVANNETKIRCYMPRIFISAIQLLLAILLAFDAFDKKIHTIIGEEYLYDVKTNLVLNEITDSFHERIQSQELTKFISSIEIPRVMKLLVQCFILRKQQRSLTQFINAAFGSFEGVTLIKRIKSFTSIMHMLVLRGEFEPLVDVFEQYMSGRCSEKLYKKRVRDICPSRGLFAISNHGKGVIRVRHASDGAPMLTVVPVLMIPPPEFNQKKKDN
ncbi:hypothetical protein TVAG_154660 [Trichomonas vaginalis G3]|uniref:Uncharacterized protein n=1 Tax=Trichomonas vaginalis (strain ATCC PRA-98 / G3) TaxID=412133 RepID=A2F257_TRIV3|nr:hypothetical protein TVAGG3_0163950 [Trichomonas vaginalis G3]EAY00996.1 hypothetical protein TVAG_154660 [Trichomonas vaginalis G3]KAI5548069.1 hypothetical protein TVAGG3_0163950 [Trichomonas vaginalis G3]|eukprot:XP_001313893.1 hypothetical protein [Trichomonas vaginalis G3]